MKKIIVIYLSAFMFLGVGFSNVRAEEYSTTETVIENGDSYIVPLYDPLQRSTFYGNGGSIAVNSMQGGRAISYQVRVTGAVAESFYGYFTVRDVKSGSSKTYYVSGFSGTTNISVTKGITYSVSLYGDAYGYHGRVVASTVPNSITFTVT